MRFGIRDITDVTFKARTDTKIGKQTFKVGQPVLVIDTAKTATLEGAATTVYAQGGRGNPRLVAWEGERTITFTLEDALLSPTSFAMLTGAGLANVSAADSDNKVKVPVNFELPILKGGYVEIDLDTAGADHDIFIDDDEFPVYGMILDNAGSPVVYCDATSVEGVEPNCNVYTLTKDNKLRIAFSGADRYVGKTMLVDCYVEKTGGVTEINIDAENFAGNYYVEAKTFFREEYSALDMPVVITLPNVKIQSNFTFTMANSGDPSTFTFTMDCFPAYVKGDHTKKVFASIDMVADENIHPDNPDEEETDASCEPLTTTFTSVNAGTAGWDALSFDGDAKDVQFNTLGNNLSAYIDRANVDFRGNLKRVDNWEAFSTNADDLTGHYYPFSMEAPNGYTLHVENGTAIRALNKKTKAADEDASADLVFGQTGDGDNRINAIVAVAEEQPVLTVTLSNPGTTADPDAVAFEAAKYKYTTTVDIQSGGTVAATALTGADAAQVTDANAKAKQIAITDKAGDKYLATAVATASDKTVTVTVGNAIQGGTDSSEAGSQVFSFDFSKCVFK